MTQLRVSIVIATFNRSNLLCTAIDSVFKQDFPESEREIIVVDDGSTDDTRDKVASRYGDKVRYLYKPNGGINSAYAHGFAAAAGEIVAQLDSDDYWYPDKLSTCVPLFEKWPDVVAVIHDLDIYKLNDPVARGTSWQSLNVLLTETPCDALAQYLEGHPVPAITSGSLWRRSALKNILPFPTGLWGFCDAYCARNIIFYGSVCAIKRSLGGYLVHDSNDYGGGNSQHSKARIERGIADSMLMSDSFNDRCRKFERVPSARRTTIQKLALVDSWINFKLLHEGRWSVIRWIIKNELDVPPLARIQGIFNVTLPPRLAVFLKNRVIGKFAPLD